MDKLPLSKEDYISLRPADFASKNIIVDMSYDIFAFTILNSNVRGRDLLRLCNSSSKINNICNARNQDLFKRVIQQDFGLKVETDARNRYLELYGTTMIANFILERRREGIVADALSASVLLTPIYCIYQSDVVYLSDLYGRYSNRQVEFLKIAVPITEKFLRNEEFIVVGGILGEPDTYFVESVRNEEERSTHAIEVLQSLLSAKYRLGMSIDYDDHPSESLDELIKFDPVWDFMTDEDEDRDFGFDLTMDGELIATFVLLRYKKSGSKELELNKKDPWGRTKFNQSKE
jgi:hypothetical protein